MICRRATRWSTLNMVQGSHVSVGRGGVDRSLPGSRVVAMPRLIHLNGPSRVGKSTLARRFADEHPGTLALDLDVLAGLVGGGQADFSGAYAVARGHGQALATRHLREGYDVIVPQLVTSHDRVPGF